MSQFTQHYTPTPAPRRADWYDYTAAACLVAILTILALAYFDILTK